MAKRKEGNSAVKVAVVGAISTVLVAVIADVSAILQQQQAVSSPTPAPTIISAPTPTSASNFDYSVRVQKNDASSSIPNAKVTIEVIGQAPLDEITDSNGIARFFIDTNRAGQPARLIIRAAGYRSYNQNIDLRQATLPDVIPLELETSNTPVATSTTLAKIAPVSTPNCRTVHGMFTGVWTNVLATIGCASADMTPIQIVEENFEHGKMIWRGETIDHGQALVLFDDGTWNIFTHSSYKEGSPEYPCADSSTPPKSPPTPKRGFGTMWCDIPEIRNGLGNAIDVEQDGLGYMQRFDNGFMLRTNYNATFVFYSNKSWEQR